MANIKELIQSIESGDSSFDEKLAAINQMEETLVAMREQEQESIDDNVELIIEALRTIEAKVEAKLRIVPEKGEQGIQGQKGEQGDRGLDGAQGKDGKSGVDGKDGIDGKDGVSVQDAKIDFDGSLVITLSDGREINVGEVVPVDVAQTIHKIQSGSGGDSQTTLNAIAALQATIATYGTMATQNANNVAITGGTINNTTIGATTPSTGVFTTLGVTTSINASSGSANADLNVNAKGTGNVVITPQSTNAVGLVIAAPSGSTGNSGRLFFDSTAGVSAIANIGGNQLSFRTGATIGSSTGSIQALVAHTASAVNYVQVTGAATGSAPIVSAQGSDANIPLRLASKGTQVITFSTNYAGSGTGNGQFNISHTASTVNTINVTGSATGIPLVISATGSDTNIPLVLQPKGTGALQAQQTDSTATGGNARGANAVDWQTLRSVNSMVASATASVIVGGQNNTASAYTSFVGAGANSYAQGSNSFVGAGNGNVVSSGGAYGAIVAGNSNTVSSLNGFVGGGASNTSGGYYNFIGAGFTNSGTSASAVTTQSGTMNATTAVTLSGSNANIKVGQYITGTSISGDTYVAAISGTSLTLSKVASGSSTSTLSFYTPHGVVVGGGNNQATGSYSFIGGGGDAGTAANRNVASGDWSVVGGGRGNVASNVGTVVVGGGSAGDSVNRGNTASGAWAVIVGGLQSTASGVGSVILGGNSNAANGNYSTATGANASTRGIFGNFTLSTGALTALGDNQTSIIVLKRQTTDATATVLTSDNTAAGTTNQVILPNNSAYYFRGEVVAGVTGGGNTKGWFIEGVIKRGANAASTALVGTPTVTSLYADAGAATWTIAVTADTTNGGLAVTFTGQASTTIRTVAQIRTTEMTY